MPFHDEYARVTPYELAFPDLETAEERLTGLRESARERSQLDALEDPGRFLTLSGVAEVLQEIRDPRSDAEALQKHGVLLFHAFHFEEAERPLFLLETHVARYLVESGPGEAGPADEAPAPPAPSGYVQLPRNLFWTEPSEEGPPEPVDGIFWSAPGGERISVLLAAGIRGDRPGLSVVPLPAVPLKEAGTWLGAEVRPGGRDFESTLPGGEMERLYSLEAAGEVLKLLARLFRYVESFPETVRPAEAPRTPAADAGPDGEDDRGDPTAGEGDGAGDPPGEEPDDRGAGAPATGARQGPRPSRLPYRRIVLEEDTDS